MEVYRPKGRRFYYYDVSLPGQPRVRKSTGLTNKSDAQLKANDDLAKARDNGSVDVLRRKAPVLEVFAIEFIEWVKATQTLKHHARRYYTNGWGWLKDTLVAKMPMDKISNHNLETIQFPGEPENHSSANCSIRTLRKMYTKAKEMKKFYGERPQFKLREEVGRSIQMSPEQAEQIDAHWEPGEESQNSRDLFRTICSSGFRPDECFRTRWEYVIWERAVYCNSKGKTPAARREVPLNLPPFDCVQVLRDRWKRMGCPKDGWIFPSPKSTSGHMVTIHKPFTKARNRAGLPQEMVLYTARHGACTRVAEVTTLKAVMQLMGHADIKTALKYQHPDSKGIGEKLWEQMKTQTDEKLLQKMGVKL